MLALTNLLCNRLYQDHIIATTIIEEPEHGRQDWSYQRSGWGTTADGKYRKLEEK